MSQQGEEDRKMPLQNQETASSRAYRELRLAIVEGRVPTEHKLTEQALAAQFNISRTPVREAIKRLLLEGLLERRPGQGLWCAMPNPDDIREIFDLRLRLESYAAKVAASRATDTQVQLLLASAARMQQLVQDHSVSEGLITQIDQENSRFHALIIDATHSQRLNLLVKSTVDISLVSRTFRRFTPEQRRRSAYHHQEIAAAIAARAPIWAEQMMHIHILCASEIFTAADRAEAVSFQ
ncbi:MAG: GntR family transcriptional regulator [Paracoccus sp. (in: a-proteobacteria)]|uniref:GntR family transcriptional regulator n=1 Tax=Paracoccus sp. TaxID=267 RepID=UPI0026DF5C4D|nr:GntR family transcriptional regulator [Paracoccus sp. (in: a-proteobacteria)]MDO5632377.1 GntR family transcriptional regulator [Paracoccus sp. (in: a-proteobacteria)]